MVLHHVEDRDKALEEITRASNPGAVYLLDDFQLGEAPGGDFSGRFGVCAIDEIID